MENEKTQLRKAIFATSILSIVLGWVFVVGPFVAGFVGGRKAKDARAAVFAALGPAFVWAGIWLWLSRSGIRIGKETVSVPAALFATTTAAAILGGALAGSDDKPARIIGCIAGLCALAWFGNGAWQIISFARFAASSGGDGGKQTSAANKTCPERLKKLYDAVMLYSDSWDGQLPPADHWVSALRDKSQPFGEEEYVHCPAVSDGKGAKYGYAMNLDLTGKRVREIKDAAKTPLFFDFEDISLNASVPATAIPAKGRHDGKTNVVFADGHVGQK